MFDRCHGACWALMWGLICAPVVSGCDDDTEDVADAAPEPFDEGVDAPDEGVDIDEGAEPDEGVEADEGVEPDGGAPLPAEIGALMDRVDLTRYSQDLELLSRAPRPVGSPGWQAAQDRCAEVFLAAGLEVTRQPLFAGGVNVIGVLPGTTTPDERLVVGAHHDSVHDCTGADDNASGVAGVLEAARVLGARRYARTLVFVCFDDEEAGLVGSSDYAARARAEGDDIVGMVAFEMIGYTDDTPGSQTAPEGLQFVVPDFAAALDARERRGDFIAAIGDDDPLMIGHLHTAATALGLPLLDAQLGEALRDSPLTIDFKRSDHAPFWANGYPGIMITDTANFRNPNYHCALGDDDIASLDLDFALDVTTAVVGAVALAAEPAEGEPVEGRMVDPAPTAPDPLLCDPVGGACEGGERCALRSNEGLTLACIAPPADGLAVDAPCERDAEGGDTCAPGLFCTLTGRAPGSERRCRPLCRSASDCAAGEACPDFGVGVGNCIEGCDPFADGCAEGMACTVGADSSGRGASFFCRIAGPAGEGEPCGEGCRAGLVCAALPTHPAGSGCFRPCRVSDPECGADQVCRRFYEAGIDEDLGLCLPADALRE